METGQTSDLWWKNAVIYCVDVETYRDSNGDGIGDFAGLTEMVGYLDGIGVTTLWLMPFYASPNRDNGYDISDFYAVDPRLGTLGDLVELLRAARERGIRTIADLVVNHTSIDHPWFQEARRNRDSPYRDYYIWADEAPADAQEGVIFPGVQHTTWTYDREAGQYYMHRFRSHQPDLNMDNPAVRQEIERIIGFWMQLGLSGFRVDAVPFLIEAVAGRPPAAGDPHDYLRELRAFMTRRRGDAILLAEANEPADKLAAYFGDQHGDQMHMLFNFLGNQASYLSLVRGEARPLVRALRALPPHPESGQWANFVRNHDELSLDKLTDSERQEVWDAFAPEPEMRIYERGIRRRFPPMVDGDRRRIELMYSLCFSLPGTPVLFYGEEIGMGDDQSLPERDAVRTAMQWSGREGAGFSAAPRNAVVRPPIREGPFAHDRLNVDDQRRDPASLLNWFERVIRLRKEWPELGHGEAEIVATGRRAVLAHLCRWNRGTVVAVHNFGARRAMVRLDVTTEDPMGWRHIFGPGLLSDPGPGPIDVSLGPFGYAWYGARRRF
jgi:maltose alpha-D-glucosyltransferase/alpha-amylase